MIRQPLSNFMLALTLLLGLLFPTTSKAGLVMASGSLFEVDPVPSSVGSNALQSNNRIHWFAERSGFQLAGDLSVDVTSPGFVNNLGGATPGVVSSGTVVDSYFFHLDPNISSGFLILDGTATFDSDVLGIVLSDSRLNLSDSVLGTTSTAYPTGISLRGAATGIEANDFVRLSADRRTVDIRLGATFDGFDQIRIVTSTAVPEPSSMVLVATCLGAGLVTRRRRFRK